MDTLNNNETLQHSKDGFQVWLKKFHEQFFTKNQALKSCVSLKQQINKELNVNIEKLSNNSLNTSVLAIDVIPNRVKMQLEAGVNHLRVKSEQLSICNETINVKVEDETKKMRTKFYEMIVKDELSLKPYYEVEEAIKDLTLKADCNNKRKAEDKENFVRNLKERESFFTEIQQSILMMEPIEQEMRLFIQSCSKKFEEKLNTLKLKTVEEAREDSNESKEILADITNMKSQLRIQ